MPKYRELLQKNISRAALQVCETLGTPEQWEYLTEHAKIKLLEKERREHDQTKAQLRIALDTIEKLETENQSLRKMKHKNQEILKSIQSLHRHTSHRSAG